MTTALPICIELPFPPSTNNLFVNGKNGRGRYKSPAYKAWRDEAGWAAKEQVNGQRIAGRYLLDVLLVAPNKQRRDASNFLKAVEDLLVWLNITDDDCNCKRVSAEWMDDGPPCLVVVTPFVEVGK